MTSIKTSIIVEEINEAGQITRNIGGIVVTTQHLSQHALMTLASRALNEIVGEDMERSKPKTAQEAPPFTETL